MNIWKIRWTDPKTRQTVVRWRASRRDAIYRLNRAKKEAWQQGGTKESVEPCEFHAVEVPIGRDELINFLNDHCTTESK